MALVVETGTGVIGADSYASVAEADAYWAGRSGADAAAWAAALLPAKEAALRDASLFIDVYHLSGYGPLVDGQGLAWPHEGYEFSLSNLNLLRRAVMMIAPLALGSPLLVVAPAEPAVVQKIDKVGELMESRTYKAPTGDGPVVVAGRDLTFLYALLAPLRGSGLVIGRRVLG